MHDLLQLLSKCQLEVEARAFAHYSSSKYHRLMGVRWGIAASGLTASASLATMAGAAMKLDSVKAALSEMDSSIILIVSLFAIVLFAFAIASALEAFFAHPKQATSHMVSYAGYSHAMRRLETLRLRCDNPSVSTSEMSTLLTSLDEISQQIKEVAAASIYPLPNAYRDGKEIKEADLKFGQEWEKAFGRMPSTANADVRKSDA